MLWKNICDMQSEKIKIQNGCIISDGEFYVSSWLVYSTQSFNQTLDVAVKVLCRRG